MTHVVAPLAASRPESRSGPLLPTLFLVSPPHSHRSWTERTWWCSSKVRLEAYCINSTVTLTFEVSTTLVQFFALLRLEYVVTTTCLPMKVAVETDSEKATPRFDCSNASSTPFSYAASSLSLELARLRDFPSLVDFPTVLL